MKVLVVVDMQNDFVNGALGTKEAEAIVPKVAKRSKALKGRFFIPETHMKRIIWTPRKESSCQCLTAF